MPSNKGADGARRGDGAAGSIKFPVGDRSLFSWLFPAAPQLVAASLRHCTDMTFKQVHLGSTKRWSTVHVEYTTEGAHREWLFYTLCSN